MSFSRFFSLVIKYSRLLARGEISYVGYRFYSLFYRLLAKQSDTTSTDKWLLEDQEFVQPYDVVLEQQDRFSSSAKNALVVHMYYPEVFFDEIHPYIAALITERVSIDLFITIPEHMSSTVLEKIVDLYPNVYFHVAENRGRDIYPFLQVLKKIVACNYEWVGKVHTKKSTHRLDGELWRKDLYSSLLSVKNVKYILDLPSGVGIVSPSYSLLDVDLFMGSNQSNVKALLDKLGLKRTDFKFIAGSMFWFRPVALKKYSEIESQYFREKFEQEKGQIDGTLAHAVERTFVVLSESGGFKTVSF